MNGRRVFGYCDENIRVVDEWKRVGNSDKWTCLGITIMIRVGDDLKIIGNSSEWMSGVRRFR